MCSVMRIWCSCSFFSILVLYSLFCLILVLVWSSCVCFWRAIFNCHQSRTHTHTLSLSFLVDSEASTPHHHHHHHHHHHQSSSQTTTRMSTSQKHADFVRETMKEKPVEAIAGVCVHIMCVVVASICVFVCLCVSVCACVRLSVRVCP